MDTAKGRGKVSFDQSTSTLSAGSLKMIIKQGDLTQESADAVVNSTDTSISMQGNFNHYFNYYHSFYSNEFWMNQFKFIFVDNIYIYIYILEMVKSRWVQHADLY